MSSIAIINPIPADGLTRTVVDGMLKLQSEGFLDFKLCAKFDYQLDTSAYVLEGENFIEYARGVDLILFCYSKRGMNRGIADMVDRWNKTVYIDGGEIGKNGRYDENICKRISDLSWSENGKIDIEMLNKCPLYMRREIPYIRGIKPLPFGVESLYYQYYDRSVEKDIDFFCVFGQDEYPRLRSDVTKYIRKFCRKNNFTCFTDRTKSREDFYRTLARSKVGISIGGGGFDTFRFWEILGNNCYLLTEKIAIYEPESKRLDYERIKEFSDLETFKVRLEEMASFIRDGYDKSNLDTEYQKILAEHSSRARVLEIIREAKNAGIIK